MFNRTYNRQSSKQDQFNQTSAYNRRMSGYKKLHNGGLRRGFSGFHEPETISVNKTKDLHPGVLTTVHSKKPILSSFRKKQDKPIKLNFLNTKSSFRQTATEFIFKPKQKVEQRFWETAVNGFGLNRPMSKQQSRNNKSNIKQTVDDEDLQQQIYIDDGIDSNIEDMDEQDKQMMLNFQKMQPQNQIIIREQRPQTSKGFRKKNPSIYDLEASADQNLFAELQASKNKQPNFQQIKIPIRSMYYDKRKDGHPSSAHPKNQTKAQKQFDNMFKTSSPKKMNIDSSAPFQSLIGSEFLSLFANGKN